MNEPITDI